MNELMDIFASANQLKAITKIADQLTQEFLGRPVDHILEVAMRMRCRDLLDVEGYTREKFILEIDCFGQFKIYLYDSTRPPPGGW